MFHLASKRSLRGLVGQTKASSFKSFSVFHGLNTPVLDYSGSISPETIQAELLPHISDREAEKPTKLWNEKLFIDAYHGRRAEFMDKLLRMNEHGIKPDAETWTAKIALFARLHSFELMLEEMAAMETQLEGNMPKFMWESLANALYTSVKKTARFHEGSFLEPPLSPSPSLHGLDSSLSKKASLEPILAILTNQWRLLRLWDAQDVEEKRVVPFSGYAPSSSFRGVEQYSFEEMEKEGFEGTVSRVGVTGGTFVMDKIANLMKITAQPLLLAALIDPAFVPASLLPPSVSVSDSSFSSVAQNQSADDLFSNWNSPPSVGGDDVLSLSALSPASSYSLYSLSSNYHIASAMLRRGFVTEARQFVEEYQNMWASPSYYDEMVGAVALHQSTEEAEDLIHSLKDQHKVIVSSEAWDGIAHAFALKGQEAEIIRLRRDQEYFHNRVKLHKFEKPFFVLGSELAEKVVEARARERLDRYERETEGSILRKLNF